VTSTWSYGYQVQYPLRAQQCSGCVASFYWENQNDFDELDFYNSRFMGFAQASIASRTGAWPAQVPDHRGLRDLRPRRAPSWSCDTPQPCHSDSYADLGKRRHGHEYELDQYATDRGPRC